MDAWDALITAIVACLLAVNFVAAIKILHRMGYSGWWSILSVIPIANVIGLWILSKVRWPKASPVKP
jgi:hypothetical protein